MTNYVESLLLRRIAQEFYLLQRGGWIAAVKVGQVGAIENASAIITFEDKPAMSHLNAGTTLPTFYLPSIFQSSSPAVQDDTERYSREDQLQAIRQLLGLLPNQGCDLGNTYVLRAAQETLPLLKALHRWTLWVSKGEGKSRQMSKMTNS